LEWILRKKRDSVILDIGCIKNSYCSDMTRTIFYKQASKEMECIYHIVLEANQKAIEKIQPGVSCREIDLTARKIISAAGYGEYFIHRTGHFIGLEDHEYGDISSENSVLLEPGMIFSIEPGIYLPGKFGVRIEDLVVVTKNGCEILNTYTKDLTVIS
jgi:Xaa-Pro dipeptidase